MNHSSSILQGVTAFCAALFLFLPVSLAVGQEMSGTYVVDDSASPSCGPDFTDLGDAFVALKSNGVDGPVRIVVFGGPYTSDSEDYLLNSISGTSATNSIVVESAPGHRPVITGPGHVMTGANSDEALLGLDGVDHFTLRGFELTSSQAALGILATQSSSHIVIDGNVIHGLQGAGIFSWGGSSSLMINDHKFINNVVWDCPGGGTHTHSWSNGAIAIRRPESNVVVAHNTILHVNGFANSGAITVTGASEANMELADLSNNIVINATPSAYCLSFETNQGVEPTVANGNLFFQTNGATDTISDIAGAEDFAGWQALGFDADGQETDPLLESIVAPYDLSLTPQSPAIDAGIVGVGIEHDFEGRERPQGAGVDVGAQEYSEESLPGVGVPWLRVERDGDLIDVLGTDVEADLDVGTPTLFQYTVTNLGTEPLELQSAEITGRVNCSAMVELQTPSSVCPQRSETFEILVTLESEGDYQLTVAFGTNDSNADPFSFHISNEVVTGLPSDPSSDDSDGGCATSAATSTQDAAWLALFFVGFVLLATVRRRIVC